MTEQVIIFFQIVFIDLVLAGDNAIVIGMVASQFDHDLRKKYPALKDAYDHYQNVKQMCETREKEEDAS